MRAHHRFPQRILSIILLLSALLLPGCRDTAPIPVGFVGGLSGRVADLGIGGRDGATLAIEEINAEGGIRRRRLELLVADDKQDVETAREAFGKLFDEKVVAVIGPMTSAMAMQLVPLADEARLPLVSPTVSANELSGKDDYFFRIYPASRKTARALAAYAREKRGMGRVAVIYDLSNRAHVEGWMENFATAFEEKGGKVAARLPFFSGKLESFSELTDGLPGEELDAVLILAGAIDTAMICQQLRKQGNELAVFTSEWSATRDLLSLGGRSVEGLTLFHTFDRSSRQNGFVSFKRRFFERFGYEPGFAATHGYDAVKLVASALEDGDGTLSKELLRSREVMGAQSRIRLDEFGDAGRDFFLLRVQDGRFISLED